MYRISVVALALCTSSVASAEEKSHREVAKKIIADYGKAVVPVTITMKMEMTIKGAGQANDSESQQETLATIVDPSGLAFIQLPKNNQNEQKFNDDMSMKVNKKITSIKLRLEDGTEIPVKIVLKDEDKGIAMVSPKTNLDDAVRGKFKHLAFNDLAKDTDVLDSLIMITRLGKTMGSEPAVDLIRLRAKLTKPQPCFVCDNMQSGAPVFDTSGKLVGLIFPKSVEEATSSGGGITISFGLGSGENVLVPAADLTDLIKQALAEVQKPAKK